jgi:hypothetical protein
MEANFKTYIIILMVSILIGGLVCFLLISEAERYNSPQFQMVRQCQNQTYSKDAYVRVDGNITRCCRQIPSSISINEVKCELLDWSKR